MAALPGTLPVTKEKAGTQFSPFALHPNNEDGEESDPRRSERNLSMDLLLALRQPFCASGWRHWLPVSLQEAPEG